MQKTFTILYVLLTATATWAQAPTSLIQGVREIGPLAYYEVLQEAERSYQRKDYTKALELYKKLTAYYPLEGQTWSRMAFLLYSAGEFNDAANAFMKAAQYGHPIMGQYYASYIARSYARVGDADNAFLWLERSLRLSRYNQKTTLLNDAAFVSLKNEPRFLELVGALPKQEFTRDEGWRYDVDYLLSEIKRLNPVYSKQPFPEELNQASNRLKAEIPKLSNEQILFEMQHLLTLLKQTHHGLYPSGQEKMLKLTQLPLRFYAFPEGLYIVDAADPYQDLIGAKVLSFDETSAERALEATGYVISRENDMQIIWEGPDHLRTLQLLHALNITRSPDRADLTVLDRNGKTRKVSPVPSALSGDQKLKAPRIAGLAPPPNYLRFPDDNYWFEHLREDKAVYLQFNKVRDKQNAESLAQFAFRVRAFLSKNKIRTLIVDVRRNNGGTTEFYFELLRTLIDYDADEGHKLFVITGRNTFSAASNFITDVDRLTNAVFVGEPSSSTPLIVGGDESSIVLPYSGIGGAIARTTWKLTFPDDSRLWIAPQIPVALTAKDYFGNRDPAMESILNLIRSRPTPKSN